MKRESRLFVTGHRGMVGSACVRALKKRGFESILTRSKAELDLTNRDAVYQFFEENRPGYVIHAAAKVGGIEANRSLPVEFLEINTQIQLNVISACHRFGVSKLLFLGSSCIYPKLAPQPIEEKALLTGPLEPTNDAYAIAKINGIRLCQAYQQEYGDCFICAMPTNLYGPEDNFDLESSHVLPALIRRFHEAKVLGKQEVVLWGTGKPKREFLFVDDLADACLFLLEHYSDPEIINVGVGWDLTIADLAEKVRSIVAFPGKICWDSSYPDGTPRKWLNVEKIEELGWKSQTSLDEGIAKAYQWFLENKVLTTVP